MCYLTDIKNYLFIYKYRKPITILYIYIYVCVHLSVQQKLYHLLSVLVQSEM